MIQSSHTRIYTHIQAQSLYSLLLSLSYIYILTRTHHALTHTNALQPNPFVSFVDNMQLLGIYYDDARNYSSCSCDQTIPGAGVGSSEPAIRDKH